MNRVMPQPLSPSDLQYLSRFIPFSPSVFDPGNMLIALAVFAGGTLVLGDWRRSWPLLLAAVTYWLQLFAYSMVAAPLVWYRTLVPGLVPFIGFTALQCATLKAKRLRLIACGMILTLSGIFALHWTTGGASEPYERWRETAEKLRMARRPGDVVVFYPAYAIWPIQYYLEDLPAKTSVTVPLGSDAEASARSIDKLIESAPDQEEQPAVFFVVRLDLAVEHDRTSYDQLLSSLRSRWSQRRTLSS